MFLDIKIEPPQHPGERPAPTPSEEELDTLFECLGEEALRHPGLRLAHGLFFGLSVFLDGHKALLELLVRRNVITPFQASEFEEIRAEINARGEQRTARDFIGLAAQGLIRINGSPLTPDEISSFTTAFFTPSVDGIAAAFRMIVQRAYTPDRLASLYAALKDSQTPLADLWALGDRKSEQERLEERVRRLEAEVARLREGRAG